MLDPQVWTPHSFLNQLCYSAARNPCIAFGWLLAILRLFAWAPMIKGVFGW